MTVSMSSTASETGEVRSRAGLYTWLMAPWSTSSFGPWGSWTERWVRRSHTIPRWGVPVLVVSAIPGLLIALLSVLLLVTSLLALLLLTLPVYRLLVWVGGGRARRSVGPFEGVSSSPGSKPVQARVIEP